MARIFQDGMELGSLESTWTVVNYGDSSSAIISSSPTPRTGTYAWRCGAYTGYSDVGIMQRKLLNANKSKLWVRLCVYPELYGSNITEVTILRLLDSAGGIQATLTYKRVSQTINIYQGDGAVLLGSYSMLLYMWHSIRVYYEPLNSGGVATVYLNGVEVITYSGDTQATANANIRYVDIGMRIKATDSANSLKYIYFDDIAINDDSGSAQNGMMGDGGIIILKPNGNGNYSQLVGSDGNSTDNYALVDEVPPNGTDYVGSATAGQKDTYAMSDVPSPFDSVILVRQIITASLASTGTGSVKPILRAGSTDYTYTDFVLGVGYSNYVCDILYTHPDSSAWSTTNLNSIEAGGEVV